MGPPPFRQLVSRWPTPGKTGQRPSFRAWDRPVRPRACDCVFVVPDRVTVLAFRAPFEAVVDAFAAVDFAFVPPAFAAGLEGAFAFVAADFVAVDFAAADFAVGAFFEAEALALVALPAAGDFVVAAFVFAAGAFVAAAFVLATGAFTAFAFAAGAFVVEAFAFAAGAFVAAAFVLAAGPFVAAAFPFAAGAFVAAAFAFAAGGFDSPPAADSTSPSRASSRPSASSKMAAFSSVFRFPCDARVPLGERRPFASPAWRRASSRYLSRSRRALEIFCLRRAGEWALTAGLQLPAAKSNSALVSNCCARARLTGM